MLDQPPMRESQRGKFYVRGDDTIWFNIDMVSPAHPTGEKEGRS
jgi:hypothetical protein